LGVREVAEEAAISKITCQGILTPNLGTYPAAAKFVQRRLSEDKKHSRADVIGKLVNRTNADENCAKNIVTGYETWVYRYDVETEARSWQWVSNKSPTPKRSTASSVQCHSGFFFKL
jgi:hypothetical protein